MYIFREAWGSSSRSSSRSRQQQQRQQAVAVAVAVEVAVALAVAVAVAVEVAVAVAVAVVQDLGWPGDSLCDGEPMHLRLTYLWGSIFLLKCLLSRWFFLQRLLISHSFRPWRRPRRVFLLGGCGGFFYILGGWVGSFGVRMQYFTVDANLDVLIAIYVILYHHM